MAGAEHGGAELFFERLADRFHHAEMSQALSIKPYKARIERAFSGWHYASYIPFPPAP